MTFSDLHTQDLLFPVDPKAIPGGLGDGHLVHLHAEKDKLFFLQSSLVSLKGNSKLPVVQIKSFYSSSFSIPFLINHKKKMELELLFFINIWLRGPLLGPQAWEKEEEDLRTGR